ncbi:hypothetical protein HDU79_004093 [Rhizoclosmatium sp. JEL0117]|nr:hypothetical protein HDU79_004093 [Rhizoclosmatium sp. JEL0117]
MSHEFKKTPARNWSQAELNGPFPPWCPSLCLMAASITAVYPTEAHDIQEIATLGLRIEALVKSAEQNDGAAQKELGDLSRNGGWWNRSHSIDLYKMAAANGNAEAQAILGNMYMNGKEVEVESAL